MKQGKTIIILVLVLAVLGGLYAGLKIHEKKSEEEQARQEEADTIHVTEAGELADFSYTNGTDEISFVKEDGSWIYGPDKEIPMNQETVQGIADTIRDVTAVRALEEPDALADYGLEEPSYTISYTEEDGTEGRLYVGDFTGDYYYVKTEGNDTVYTAAESLVSALLFDLADLARPDAVPTISSGNLQKVEITEKGDTRIYSEEDELTELAGGFGVLSLTDCADYHVTEDRLADYGLDETNRTTAKAVYEDTDSGETKNFIVYIGGEDGSGENRYVTVDGSKMVYTVSTDVIGNMTTVSETEEE